MDKSYSKLWQGKAIINFNNTIKKLRLWRYHNPDLVCIKPKKPVTLIFQDNRLAHFKLSPSQYSNRE